MKYKLLANQKWDANQLGMHSITMKIPPVVVYDKVSIEATTFEAK